MMHQIPLLYQSRIIGFRDSTGSIFRHHPVILFFKEDIYPVGLYLFSMKEKGTSKGKSCKPESNEGTPGGTDAKAAPVKNAPMTAQEKIAANQKSKRRK